MEKLANESKAKDEDLKAKEAQIAELNLVCKGSKVSEYNAILYHVWIKGKRSQRRGLEN